MTVESTIGAASQPDFLALILTSTVVAAMVSSVIAFAATNRALSSKNVTEERAKWREHIRKIVQELAELEEKDFPKNIRSLLARLEVRLNPLDDEDKKIVDLLRRNTAWPINENNMQEFFGRISYLLKHDWERAKWEADASILRFMSPVRCYLFACDCVPKRVA